MNNFRLQIIVFVVIGFLAGITGGLIVFDIVANTFTSQGSETAVGGNNNANAPAATLDVERMGREMNQVVVDFYRKKTGGTSVLSNILLEADLLGRGSIITSDGWVLTHQSAFAGVDPRQTILMHNGAPAAVEQVIKDRATGLVFLKTNIKNVPSIRLGSMGSMHTGDKIAFGVSRGDWRLGELAKNYREFSLAPRDVLHTSEDLYRLATLANAPDKIAFGSPVVSRNNELVGVVATTRFGLAVVPIDYILTSKDEVFGSQKIDRPYLGVTYVSLPKDMLSGDAALNQNGALVTADLGVGAPGVAAKSPAALAGILAGDIITAVNDEEINQAHTLGELLMPYKKGDAIDIKLWRNGQEMTVKVTLDSILTSTVSPAKLVQ